MWPFFFFLGLSCQIVESDKNERWSLIYTNKDHKLTDQAQLSRWAKNMMECAHLCLAKRACCSFNFNLREKDSGLCELNSRGPGVDSAEVRRVVGWVYGRLEMRLRNETVAKSHTPVIRVTFTTLGASGNVGPNDTKYYIGTPLENKVRLNNGIQIWTVPETGNYNIEAWGASGGNCSNSSTVLFSSRGGLGARVKGSFTLTKGDELKILVGQKGHMAKGGTPTPGSGGGGTFVTFINNTALIIAGGGGGGGFSIAEPKPKPGDPGQATEEGTKHGGTKGEGGKRWDIKDGSGHMFPYAGGGGGLLGNGETVPRTDLMGKSFVNGGVGGTAASFSWGGFGGGGAGLGYPGGGGGYSGGGVESDEKKVGVAGGGGSYNGGRNKFSVTGVNNGDGRVEIKLIN